MATWYTVRHTFSHKHNIEHDRLNIRTLQCNIAYSITGWTLTMLMKSLKIIKFYMKCGIIPVVMSIILSIMGYF